MPTFPALTPDVREYLASSLPGLRETQAQLEARHDAWRIVVDQLWSVRSQIEWIEATLAGEEAAPSDA